MTLQNVQYTSTVIVSALCPNCGNPDCEEIEEFKRGVRNELTKRAVLERKAINAAKEYSSLSRRLMTVSLGEYFAAHARFHAAIDALSVFEVSGPTE